MKRFAHLTLLLSAGLFAFGCGQQHSANERAVHDAAHDADRAAADAERAARDAAEAAAHRMSEDPLAHDENMDQAAKEKLSDAAAIEAKRLTDKFLQSK